jgi:Cellulose biosynthesis protein BcsS
VIAACGVACVTGSAAVSEEQRNDPIRLLLYSGVDLWRNAAFAHDGLLWTPAGLGNDGFVLKALVTDGSYRYRAGALGYVPVTGWMTGSSVMPGLQFKRGGLSIAAYAGVEMQVHRLSQYDPGNRLQGQYVGARAAIDLWAEPTPQSMVIASATFTTIGGAYAARAATGWRLFDRFYVGPEAVAFGGPEYRQLRLGLHVTGLKVELFDWRFEYQGGIGYAFDDDDNDGIYARLGVLVRH